MDRMGRVLPTIWEMAISGMEDTCEATVIGIPMAPNATGAVLAIRQMPAAYKGLKPSPTNMAAVMATGAPKPAVPSKNDPKEKAMSKACILLSEVMVAIKLLMISNWPLFTVRLNKNTAAIMIQQMGNRPYIAPLSVDSKASFTGMPYATIAMTTAIKVARRLAL